MIPELDSDRKQCPKCKEWIAKGATKCPHCRSAQPPPVGIVILVLVIFLGGSIWLFRSCSSALDSALDFKTSDDTTTPVVSVGDVVKLVWKDNESVSILGAVDETAYDEIDEAVAAKDQIGQRNLLLTGRVLLIESGTRARILDTGFGKRKVRILDGSYLGRTVWVPTETAR